MKDKVYDTIKSMVNEKIEANVAPTHIIDMDLFQRLDKNVKDALNELYMEGKIGITRTANHKAIYLKEETGGE